MFELPFRLIDGVEIELPFEPEVFELEFWLLPIKLLIGFDELEELLLLFDEETACPVTRPCKISDKFFALAYFKRKTFKPPKRSAEGTSSISIMWRMRLRVSGSPLTKIRLVRLSAIIRIRAPLKSLDAPVALIASS